MRASSVVVLVAIASSCVSKVDRIESRTLRLERDSGTEVGRVLAEKFGPTEYGCGTCPSGRPADSAPNVGVDWSAEPTIEVWVQGGDEHDLERAVELARAVDRMLLPAGAEAIALRHADADEVVATLNRLVEASFWKSRVRGCALPDPTIPDLDVQASTHASELDWERRGFREMTEEELRPMRLEVQARSVRAHVQSLAPRWFRPPPSSFASWGPSMLVVLEAHRDDAYLRSVRELVARLDVETDDR